MSNKTGGVSTIMFIIILVSIVLLIVIVIQLGVGPQGPQGEPGIGFETQGNVSVSPAAFHPLASTDRVANYGDMLTIGGDEPAPIKCVAGVQLPHGATITNITVRWIDNGPDALYFALFGEGPGGLVSSPYLYSHGEEGGGIDKIYTYLPYDMEHTVDNNNNFYWMEVKLPAFEYPYKYYFCGAFIEYEYIP